MAPQKSGTIRRHGLVGVGVGHCGGRLQRLIYAQAMFSASVHFFPVDKDAKLLALSPAPRPTMMAMD